MQENSEQRIFVTCTGNYVLMCVLVRVTHPGDVCYRCVLITCVSYADNYILINICVYFYVLIMCVTCVDNCVLIMCVTCVGNCVLIMRVTCVGSCVLITRIICAGNCVLVMRVTCAGKRRAADESGIVAICGQSNARVHGVHALATSARLAA